ncbi:MAG TPA: TonB family protein [Chthoniobacterales bacterium]|jgi:TonB family protein
MRSNREQRKIWWAVLASIVAHLLVGLSLAAFGGSRTEMDLPVEEPPPQLTIMQEPEPTPPPLVPKHAPMTTVDESRKSKEAPKEKTFEANENSIAAAEKAATTDNPLPGQDGKDRPFMNLEEHPNSFGSAGAAPQPTPSPTAPSEKQPTPSEKAQTVAATPPPDQLALLTQTPTPVPSPAAEEEKTEPLVPTPTPTPTPELTPPSPASSYRDLQQKTIIRGGIDNRGHSSVNAVGTPQGRYKKLLEDAIGSRWYYYTAAKMDIISIGTTRVTFDINADGKVENLRMIENTGNEASASIALRSIQETKFPPIPEDLRATIPEGRFTMEESFTIFANR